MDTKTAHVHCSGHTSYCEMAEVKEPRVHASGISDLIYVGFHNDSRSRLGHQTFFSTREGGAGQVSFDGGVTFPYFIVSGYAIPENKGSQQMATDGNGTWLLARTLRHYDPTLGPPSNRTVQFARATDDSIDFVSLPLDSPDENVVAADITMGPQGDAARIYTLSVPITGGGFAYQTKVAYSTDGGLTWDEETDVPMAHSGNHVLTGSIRLVTNGQGQYLLVWQTPTGLVAFTAMPSTITAARDWTLFQ